MKTMLALLLSCTLIYSPVQSLKAQGTSTLPRMDLKDLATGLNELFKSLKTTKNLFLFLGSAAGPEQKVYLELSKRLPNELLPEVVWEGNVFYLKTEKSSHHLVLNEKRQVSFDGLEIPGEKTTFLQIMHFLGTTAVPKAKPKNQGKNWRTILFSPVSVHADQGAVGPIERMMDDLARPIQQLTNRALGRGSQAAGAVIVGGVGAWAATALISALTGVSISPAIPVAVVVGILAYMFVYKNPAFAAEGGSMDFRCLKNANGDFRMNIGGRQITYQKRVPEGTHPGALVYQAPSGGRSFRCAFEERGVLGSQSQLRTWHQLPCEPRMQGFEFSGVIAAELVRICQRPGADRDHAAMTESLNLLRGYRNSAGADLPPPTLSPGRAVN